MQDAAEAQLEIDIEKLEDLRKRYATLKIGETLKPEIRSEILKGTSEAARADAEAIATGTKSMEKFVIGQRSLIDTMKGTSIGFKLATASVRLFSAALNILPIIAISLVIKGITHLIQKNAKAIEKADETTKAWAETLSDLSSKDKAISDISSDYEKLAKGVDQFGRNISLTTDEYARYNEIVNQIAEMFPTMVVGYTDEGNAIIRNKGNVEELTAAYEDLKKVKNQEILSGAPAAMEGFERKYSNKTENSSVVLKDRLKYSRELLELIEKQDEEALKSYFNLQSGIDYSLISKTLKEAGISNNLTRYKWTNNTEEAAKLVKENVAALENIYKTALQELEANAAELKPIIPVTLSLNPVYDNMESEVQDAINAVVQSLDGAFFTQFKGDDNALKQWVNNTLVPAFGSLGFSEQVVEMLDFSTAFKQSELSVSDYITKWQNFLDFLNNSDIDPQLKEQIEKTFDIQVENMPVADALENLKSRVAEGATDIEEKLQFLDEAKLQEIDILLNVDDIGSMTVDELQSKVKAAVLVATELQVIMERIDKLQSIYDTILTGVQEHNENGFMSVDAFQAIMNLGPEYLSFLDAENGAIKMNEEALRSYMEAQLEELAVKQVLDMIEAVSKTESEAEAMKYLTATTLDAADATWALVEARREALVNQLDLKYGPNNVVVQQLDANIAAARAALSSAKSGLKLGGMSGKSSGSSKNQDKENAKRIKQIKESLAKLDEEAHFDKLKKSVETVTLLINQLSDSLDTLALKLDLTYENDFASQMNIRSAQYDVAIEKGKTLRQEFERLAKTTPRTADEAQYLADRISSLGSELRDNLKSVIEYRKEIDLVRLNAITASSENVTAALERETKLIDYNIDILTKGSMLGAKPFSMDFLLPSLPESALERQRKENDTLIAEQKRYQEEIFRIQKEALEKQMAANVAEREKQRKQLLEDLAEIKNSVSDLFSGLSQRAFDASVDAAEQDVEKTVGAPIRRFRELTEEQKRYVNETKELIGDWDTWTKNPENNLVAVKFLSGKTSDLSWDQLPLKSQAYLSQTLGYTRDSWNKMVEENPLRALILAEKGKKSWSELTKDTTEKTAALLDILNTGFSKNEIPAPQIKEETWKKSLITPLGLMATWIGEQLSKAKINIGSGGINFAQASSSGENIASSISSAQKSTPGVGILFPQISGFGNPRVHTTLKAADYSAKSGTKIPALQSGKVVVVKHLNRSYGYHVVVESPSGTQYIYAHMSKTLAKVGQSVSKGTVIGLVGSTGNSTGPHLHYGIYGYKDGGVLEEVQQNILAGEEGRELAILPNGKVVILGQNGAGLYNLPRATEIIDHQETEEVLKHTGSKIDGQQIPKFASGTSGAPSLTDATNALLKSTGNMTEATENLQEAIDALTEMPSSYSKALLDSYFQYSYKRQENLASIDKIRQTDPARAQEMAEAQRVADIEQSYQMKQDMYYNAANKLKQNYNSLLTEYNRIKDTADIDVLQKYIDGLTAIQDKLQEIDESLYEASQALYKYRLSKWQSELNLLHHQFTSAEIKNNYAAMAHSYQEQMKIYEAIMTAAEKEANRLRSIGAAEHSEEIQNLVDTWHEAEQAVLSYKKQLEDLVEKQKDAAKDVISQMQQSYIQTYKDQITDLEYAKSRDPVLQALYGQRNALEKINSERRSELALMKAKEDLAKLQDTVRIYREGQGFVYEKDQQALKSAQEALAEAQRNYEMDQLDKQISELEAFYDDQIKALQRFVEDLEHYIDVNTRERALEFTRIMEMLRDAGIATFENIQKVMDWFEKLAEEIPKNDVVKQYFGGSYPMAGDLDQEIRDELLLQMMYNSAAWFGADEEERERMHQDNVYMGNLLGLIYKDGIWYTKQGTKAYTEGFERVKALIEANKIAMESANAAEANLLKENNRLLAELIETLRISQLSQKEAIQEMINNSLQWRNVDEETRRILEQSNQAIGSANNWYYDSPTGIWYTDASKSKALYEDTILEIMRANSQAWFNADPATRKELEAINQKLGPLIGLTYHSNTGTWHRPDGTRAYKEGGIIDFTGLAEVHGSAFSPEMMLNNADVKKLYELIHNTPSLVSEFMNNAFAGTPPLAAVTQTTVNNSEPIVFSINKIEMHGVNDAKAFLKELERNIPAVAQQVLMKRN